MSKFVVISGDLEYGITEVVGPFDHEQDAWDFEPEPELGHGVVYSVDCTGLEWDDRSDVFVEIWPCGRIRSVSGPFSFDYREKFPNGLIGRAYFPTPVEEHHEE